MNERSKAAPGMSELRHDALRRTNTPHRLTVRGMAEELAADHPEIARELALRALERVIRDVLREAREVQGALAPEGVD